MGALCENRVDTALVHVTFSHSRGSVVQPCNEITVPVTLVLSLVMLMTASPPMDAARFLCAS